MPIFISIKHGRGNSKKYDLEIDIKKGETLDIIVENMGRINYGAEIVHNLKGIISPVIINGNEINGNWKMYPLPFDKFPKINYKVKDIAINIPTLKEGEFTLEETGDTFLDMRKFGKGIVFINGKNIGRYWNRVGPQLTLYVPGVWLNKGKNTIQIFEQINENNTSEISSIKTPILDQLVH